MIEYKLYRIEDDETTTEVSQHESVVDGVAAGVDMVENVDHDYAYTLRSESATVVSFREGRVGYRAWMQRSGRISPSLEDRYDHDVDELMV